jgi:hypothetical protein
LLKLGVVWSRQNRSGKHNRLLFEPYFGFGIRYNKINLSPLPFDAEPVPQDRQGLFIFTPRETTVDFMLGINVGYIFTAPPIQRSR